MTELVSYDQAIVAAATLLIEEPKYRNVRLISEVIALMFNMCVSEVNSDIRAELKEQRRGL